MYLNEIFGGLNEDISSVLKSFENSYGYKGMVLKRTSPFKVTANITSFQSWVVPLSLTFLKTGYSV